MVYEVSKLNEFQDGKNFHSMRIRKRAYVMGREMDRDEVGRWRCIEL